MKKLIEMIDYNLYRIYTDKQVSCNSLHKAILYLRRK